MASGAAFAASDEEFKQLKRIILEQQRKSSEQENRLAEQEKKLAEQERLLEEQERKLTEQQKTLSQQQRLTRQQGLILTLQDQDIYDLRGRVDNEKWPTGSTTYGDNSFGQTAAWPGSVYTESRAKAPGLILTGTTTPQAPQPIPPSGQPVPPSGAPSGPVPPTKSPDAARPKSEKAPDQLLVEAGGVLLPSGTVQFEPSFEYSHFSSNRLAVNGLSVFDAIIIGFIRADDVERDVLTGALTTRVGLFPRVQGDVRITGVWREDRETLGVGTRDGQRS